MGGLAGFFGELKAYIVNLSVQLLIVFLTMKKINFLVVSLTDRIQGPAMAAVLRKVLPRRFDQYKWVVDSVAMIKFHAGKHTDPKMVAALKEEGCDDQKHVARVFMDEDFERYDYLLPIDEQSRNFLHLKMKNIPHQPIILRTVKIANPMYTKEKYSFKDCIRSCESAARFVLCG